MRILYITVLILAISFLSDSKAADCQKRSARGNQYVSSLLKNIMSPTNSGSALQVLKMAAARNRASPVAEEVRLPKGVSTRSIIANGLPNRGIDPNLLQLYQQRLEYPSQVGVARQLSQLPMTSVPVAAGPVIPNLQASQVEVLRQILTQLPMTAQVPVVPQLPVATQVPVATQLPVKERAPCPAPLVNPFLPAASPVSALAPPTSNLLPPANINNPRSNFLRKIPIPPPSL